MLAGAAAAAWSGCSVKKHYRLLSFFFDGVPDPNAPRMSVLPGSSVPGNLRDSPTYSVHPPFAEEKCGDCHVSRFAIEAMDASVCLKCHPGAAKEYPHMHGPVAATACLWCHAPHESAYSHLFKGEARRVCTECHDSSLLSTDRVPAHADPARDCLGCHGGHGGMDRFFLKPGAEGAGPGSAGQEK